VKTLISKSERKWEINIDLTDIRKTREQHEQLYEHKLNNLDEMDQFLKDHKITKLIQNEIKTWSNPVTTF
jgi:hypothetical protein